MKAKETRIKNLVGLGISAKSAIRIMSGVGRKEVFVVDHDARLVGSLSDGDVRKWILRGGSLATSVGEICNRSPKYVERNYNFQEVKDIMLEYRIESIPVVDGKKKVVEILFWDEVFGKDYREIIEEVSLPVVIMAGGKGKRLDPFTKILPKPLIPIGEKPIIELIMDKLYAHGMKSFYVILNYKAGMIRSYFEEIPLKYEVKFFQEPKPLGTAGGLKLLPKDFPEVFLLTNCDVTIEAEYADLLRFHNSNGFDITIVVSHKNFVIPYGVCEIEKGGKLKAIVEKPEYDLLVNTGVYMLNKKLISLLSDDGVCDMNELIKRAKNKHFKIGTYPIQEKSWTDIGQWEEYHKAVKQLGA